MWVKIIGKFFMKKKIKRSTNTYLYSEMQFKNYCFFLRTMTKRGIGLRRILEVLKKAFNVLEWGGGKYLKS